MNPVDLHLQMLSKSMTLRLLRHGVIAGNIANADTPGYRPQAVAFEEALQKAGDKLSPQELSHVTAKIEVADDGQPRSDGNTVNLDRQMASLSQNSILYNATAEFIARKFRMIKSVIS